jgi:hypothetical protein
VVVRSDAGSGASPFNGQGPLLRPNPYAPVQDALTPGQLIRQQGGNPYAAAPAPAPAPQQQAPAPQQQAPAPQQQSFGGGGGGGAMAPAGAAPMAAAATQAAARPSLDDYIKSNFLYNSTKAQGDNALSDYNAGTLKGQQNVVADQGVRNNRLDQSLADQGQQNADSLAAHGLLRSGFNFQNQDKINQQGDMQRNNIANLLTDFIAGRNTGQQAQVNSNQQALNTAISNLTTQFNSGQTLA